jgi:hypothetical protein
MIFPRRVAPALLTALSIFVLSATASAATYTVNSTGNQEAGPSFNCGVAETCTLRAAIQLSNASTNVPDEILFSGAFDGEKADSTIEVAGLEAIEDELTIDGDAGGQCETDASVDGPCVGVKGEEGLDVRADDVTIEGLAISDAQIGIAVEGEEFEARDNWIGFELDGTEGSAEQAQGIFVAPHADHAVIGGAEPDERNVIGNTNSGLLLRGASHGTVLGSYFGVEPDGTTTAPNGRDLVVANKLELLSEVSATNNQIGADVGEAGVQTAECDFGCNVLASESGSTAAIDLLGTDVEEEGAATGPTQIEGNYIGLDANGAPFTEAADGIQVGNAGEVTIGGPEPGQANQIHGSGSGIASGTSEKLPPHAALPAKKLVVVGNNIGRALDNSGPLFPPDDGISLASEGITALADAAKIEANDISAEGAGVDAHSTGATIKNNRIYEANRGIFTHGDTEGSGIGSTIEGNTIDGSLTGVYIQNDLNVLTGNHIGNGDTGIAIENFLSLNSSENTIGGDTPAEGNVITSSEGNAIEIIDVEGSQNEVGVNSGSANGGKFIRLRAADPSTEPIGPNGGIKPPTVSTASKTEASGTADPEATVRVFSKANITSGELGTYLGKVTAGLDGKWKLTYLSPVAGGTFVAATQTNEEGGTSEVSTTAAVPADPSGCPAVPSECHSGGGADDGKGKNNPDNGKGKAKGQGKDKTAPQTTIAKAKVKGRTATFKFVSSEPGSTFQCKLDKKPFKPCRSPKKYKRLKPGKHVFEVRAIDAAGNRDKTPATRKFRVLPRR